MSLRFSKDVRDMGQNAPRTVIDMSLLLVSVRQDTGGYAACPTSVPDRRIGPQLLLGVTSR